MVIFGNPKIISHTILHFSAFEFKIKAPEHYQIVAEKQSKCSYDLAMKTYDDQIEQINRNSKRFSDSHQKE